MLLLRHVMDAVCRHVVGCFLFFFPTFQPRMWPIEWYARMNATGTTCRLIYIFIICVLQRLVGMSGTKLTTYNKRTKYSNEVASNTTTIEGCNSLVLRVYREERDRERVVITVLALIVVESRNNQNHGPESQ